MGAFILAFLFLPIVAFAEEVRVAVGQSTDQVLATIKKHGAIDITPGMDVIGPKGEHPLHGIYWEFRYYDAIVELTTKQGKVVRMSFWTKKDFGESKSHRAESERNITALKLNTKTGGVSIEKRNADQRLDRNR